MGVRRSRANPFKSTQLRQWGFICYLGGHIVSRRERTDRLRRASDGADPREPRRSYRRRRRPGSKGTTLSRPSRPPPSPFTVRAPLSRFPPFILRPPPPPPSSSSPTSLPSARKADSPLHVRVEISLGFCPYLPPLPLLSLLYPLTFTPTPVLLSHLLSSPEILRMGKIWPFVGGFLRRQVKRERDEYRLENLLTSISNAEYTTILYIHMYV